MRNFDGAFHFLMRQIAIILILSGILISGCCKRNKVEHVYRYYWGEKNGLKAWIVDGYIIRNQIDNSFLYGGNEQRYPFVPAGEIWIDHAVSCEEFEMTLAHEINERHLMAKFGWTYDRSHDSSLAIEVVMRRKFHEICMQHEASLPNLATTDWANKKEIQDIPDSIQLRNIYRVPMGVRNGISVWIVDGYLIRATIYPDFGFSGNDLAYHFIPPKEIWIDGQISAEETEYSIITELMERALILKGMNYIDAYDSAIEIRNRQRIVNDNVVRNHTPLIIPDTIARDTGVINRDER
jgi:hypothetical protein